MVKMSAVSIALPLLLLATPALADDPAPAAAAPAPAAAPAKPKMICRADAVTGSRVRKSTCATADQWKAYDEARAAEAKQFVDKTMQQAGLQGPQRNPMTGQ